MATKAKATATEVKAKAAEAAAPATEEKKVTARDLIEALIAEVTPADLAEMKQGLVSQIVKSGTPVVVKEPGRRGRKPVERNYDLIKIRGGINSVDKHVNGILVAVKKMMDSGEVPQEAYEEVEQRLARVRISDYKANAQDTVYEPRTSHGGRKRKNETPAEAAA